jgi:phosphohistidine swiveling domain-containing protein
MGGDELSASSIAVNPQVIGRGKLVCGGAGAGVLRWANTIDQVMGLVREGDLAETFLVTDTPSATGIVPLLGSVSGIVCRTGGLNSHIAVLAREFGIRCVLAAELDELEIDGLAVVIANDGRLIRA